MGLNLPIALKPHVQVAHLCSDYLVALSAEQLTRVR